MLGRLYEWFWRRLGLSAPITELTRALQREAPLLFLWAAFLSGIIVGRWVEGWSIIWLLIGGLIYSLLGHIFW